MLIREVHLSSKQFKEASGADIDTGSSVTSYALLAVESNMRSFINLEANQFQTLLYRY